MGPKFYKLKSGSPVLQAVVETEHGEIVCAWVSDAGEKMTHAFKRETLVEVRADGSPL